MMNKGHFNSHDALAYDAKIVQILPFYREIHSETLDLVKSIKPQVEFWLDTGCGTGLLVEEALPVFPRARFVLADPAETMLRYAMERFSGELSGSKVAFLPPVCSEELFLYKDTICPQVITAIMCHHYLKGKQRFKAIRSCYQMLDRDGLLVIVENIHPRTLVGAGIALDRWKRFQILQGRSFSTVEEHAGRFKTGYFPMTVREHIEMLESAGFHTVEVFWASHMQAGFYAIK